DWSSDVCSSDLSVTSDNLDDIVKVPEGTVSAVASPLIRAANRHVRWVDTDRHGYGVLDITAQRAQLDYYVLADRTDRNTASAWVRSYRTLAGTQKVERVHRPVRPAAAGVPDRVQSWSEPRKPSATRQVASAASSS